MLFNGVDPMRPNNPLTAACKVAGLCVTISGGPLVPPEKKPRVCFLPLAFIETGPSEINFIDFPFFKSCSAS